MTDYREHNEHREVERFMEYWNDEHPTDTVNLPRTRVVCPVCDGEGKHVNPAIDRNGISAEDFANDPDFEEEYRSGVYDVRCDTCDGRNVIDRVNWDEADPYVRLAWEEWVWEWANYRAEIAAEQRMGC